jgi:hypothetical protein
MRIVAISQIFSAVFARNPGELNQKSKNRARKKTNPTKTMQIKVSYLFRLMANGPFF